MNRMLLLLILFGPLLVCGHDWFHLEKSVGPKGDYTAEQLATVLKYDPGVDGQAAYVKWKPGNFTPFLLSEGDKPMPNTKALKPPEWSEKVHVTVTDSTPKDVHGTKTVMTDKGLQPEMQYDYWSYWKLEDRPRRMALLVEDLVEDYRIFVGYLVPKVKPLIEAFRKADMPIFWSNWLRRPDDKLYGGLDRFYGPAGVKSFENPMYIYAKEGSFTMHELAPTDEEVADGKVFQSAHLSKFADVADDGKSYLRELLKKHNIDTLVVVGAWTEDCILSTALDGADTENLDMLIVEDGVGTATPGHYPALEVMRATSALLLKSEEVVSYIEAHKDDEAYILKAELFPQVYRLTSASVRNPVFTMTEFVLALLMTAIASVGATLVAQRAITRKMAKSKQRYGELDDSRILPLESGEA